MIGLIAAILSTTCGIPQLVRVIKTKSVKDISFGMFTLQCCSVTLWSIYGLFINNLLMLAGNALVFLQAITMLILKTKYKQQS